jgi:hypothetical protein
MSPETRVVLPASLATEQQDACAPRVTAPLLDCKSVRLASECPTRLWYHQKEYPRNDTDDAFAEYLATERETLVALVRGEFAFGVPILAADPVDAAAMTALVLESDRLVAFDATFIADGLLARFDVARRVGDELHVYSVKASAGSSQEHAAGRLFRTMYGGVRTAWKPALAELAFGMEVLARANPGLEVVPHLVLPDKDSRAMVDGLPAQVARGVSAVALKAPVQRFEVAAECTLLRQSVKGGIAAAKAVDPQIRPVSPIGYHCRACPFRIAGSTGGSGWEQCWGELAKPDPHLFDLYQLWQIKNADGTPYADTLIAAEMTSLFDVPTGALVGEHAERQRLQIEVTRTGREWVDPELPERLAGLTGPWHFVDFETATPSVPHHEGVAPYEVVAFQFSCHTAVKGETAIEHREWLNDGGEYPNAQFVRALRGAIGETGTVFVWTEHERTTLREIAWQLEARGGEEDLVEWIGRLCTSGRIVDLNALCLRHYYHPANRGRSSLKKVLPPIWSERADLREHSWLAGMGDGTIRDPYECLPTELVAGRSRAVREGCGAMLAYRDRLFGSGAVDPEDRHALRNLLLRYCRLDTLAMVLVFLHWATPTKA